MSSRSKEALFLNEGEGFSFIPHLAKHDDKRKGDKDLHSPLDGNNDNEKGTTRTVDGSLNEGYRRGKGKGCHIIKIILNS